MKKFILIIFLALITLAIPAAVTANASSLLYTFSSGDILASNALQVATYGLGRIDFISNEPFPTVIISGDKRQHGLGEFTRNGHRYIYDRKVNKANENIAYYDVYDASRGPDYPIAKDLVLSVTPNPKASADLTFTPDAGGIIYTIDGTTLTRYDLMNWSGTVSATLDSSYDVYSLVGLTNNANLVYVWESKRTAISADGSYTPVSSDVAVYDRATLTKLAVFSFPRTGLDATKKRADDEPYTPEVGRGLVDISNTETDKSVVLVVYDSVSSDAAKIVRIDEAADPVSYDVVVKSSNIKGWNIDLESPIPDEIGGFYFGCYSGDANAEPTSTSRDCTVFHWNRSKGLSEISIKKAQTTAELVIKSGDRKGSIVAFYTTTVSSPISGDTIEEDYNIHTYIWNGVSGALTSLGDGFGVELEKPFTDGHDGIYFMMEIFFGSDDMDALCHWNSSNGFKILQSSPMELEVEDPPSDGNNGFYYVESSIYNTPKRQGAQNVDVGMLGVNMKLYHCIDWNTSVDLVNNLGSFDVPASAYEKASGDYLLVREQVQSEHGFLEDLEHELLFVGAGPIGGNMTLKAFTWNASTKPRLTSEHLIASFTNEDLGGYAEIVTAVAFTESSSIFGVKSSGGCSGGMFGVISLALSAMFIFRKK